LSLIDNDSHSEIQRVHNLRDTSLYEAHHTSVEMLPDRLDDCSGWELQFDNSQPDWWTPDHEKAVRDQLRRDHAVFWNPKTKIYQFGGNLDLSSVTDLKGVTLPGTCGDLDLRSVTDLKGVTLPGTCGDLDLRSEKHFYGGWISKADFLKLLKKNCGEQNYEL